MKRLIMSTIIHASLLAFLGGCLVSCQPVSPEEHYKPLVDSYLSYWNTGDMTGVESVLQPDFEIRYSPTFEPAIQGIEAFKKEMEDNRAVNFSVKVEEIVYGQDAITVRWVAEQYYPDSTGALTIPAQGKGISLVHLKDGKFADEWISFDVKDWMEQLGYEMVKKEVLPAEK